MLQVESYLRSGADATYQDTSDGSSPLMAASSQGHAEVVRRLLVAGAPWNAFDRQANCAGDYALAGQHQDCVDILLTAGNASCTPLVSNVWPAVECICSKHWHCIVMLCHLLLSCMHHPSMVMRSTPGLAHHCCALLLGAAMTVSCGSHRPSFAPNHVLQLYKAYATACQPLVLSLTP